MKAVILAGELGTHIGDETGGLPKPMIEIGGQEYLKEKLGLGFDISKALVY